MSLVVSFACRSFRRKREVRREGILYGRMRTRRVRAGDFWTLDLRDKEDRDVDDVLGGYMRAM